MRHGKKINHLGRKAGHRQALLSNMASSLILHKRIFTTVAKAKALRKYVEPLITRAKTDTMHSRRMVFSYLQNKESVKELFGTVASRIAERPGGYTRIIKLGDRRLGDSAEMCLIELVDFNEIYGKETPAKKAKTRRGRSKSKKAETPAATAPAEEKTAGEEKAANE
jgi:large subunit ribosomal protein L17